MIVRIAYKDIEKKIRFFLKHRIPFKKYSTTGRTTVITENWGSWMNKESNFKAGELHFIKQVKEYIVKQGTYKRVRNHFKKDGSTRKIKYFYYNKARSSGDYFEDIYEVDIKNAYWKTAYSLGLFDETLYQKGLTVSKKTRLAAIGSLAKVTQVIEYDGNEEKLLDPERSDTTEFLWHTICSKIGKVMAKASRIAKNDFVFFWVDAMFVRGEQARDKTEAYFKSLGYDCSIYKCEWVKFEGRRILIKSKAKGKLITKTKEEKIERDGKWFLKKNRYREWKDERPFPYNVALSDKDIVNLTAE